MAAGPAVYLLAHALFRYRSTETLGMARLLGTLACVAVGFGGPFVPALAFAGALIVVLVAVIAAGYLAALQSRGQGADLYQG